MPPAPPKAQHYEARKRGEDRELLPFVANVSWRRSGHALLRTLLRKSLGLRFGYCEYYFPRNDSEGRCCQSFPCRKAGRINMSRQHDPDLTESLPDGHPLVVLTRRFGDATVSHFDVVARRGRFADTPAGFASFADDRLAAYRAFRQKWIDAERSNRMVLTYDEVTDDRVGTVTRVLPLFGVSHDPAAIAAAIADVPVKPKRDVTAFRHYDAVLFEELNARAESEPAPAHG